MQEPRPRRRGKQEAGPGRRWRRGLVVLSACAAAATLAAACGGGDAAPPPGTPGTGTRLTTPRPAPDFTLTAYDGSSVTLSTLKGSPVFLTFLYTRCPDVCPLIAANLNAALRALGEDAARVRVVAVSVDPRGDTAESVRAYVERMGLEPQFTYLIGREQDLAPIWKAFGIGVEQRVEGPIVDHTAATYLIDADGLQQVVYGDDATTETFVRDVEDVLR
ncbi:MAG: SCO family protein [Thermoleophilia bacterium]